MKIDSSAQVWKIAWPLPIVEDSFRRQKSQWCKFTTGRILWNSTAQKGLEIISSKLSPSHTQAEKSTAVQYALLYHASY